MPALPEYVRKIDAAEILVRGWRSDTPRSHVVTVRWPRAHAFYTLHGKAISPLLFTESIRQALAVLSHTVHRIPLDHRLGWEYVRSSVVTPVFTSGPVPTTVDMRIVHTAVQRRRLGSVRVAARIDATCGETYVGCAEIGYITHPPAIYRRLRGRYADAKAAFERALPPAPAARPRHVGRVRVRDVVLSPTVQPGSWRLRVDTTNQVLFDHPHDHVPGMVMLEAAAQAAQAEALPRRVLPVSFDAVFSRYVELDQPCWIAIAPAADDLLGRPRLRADTIQDDQVVASVLVATEPLEGGRATG
ncbi:ScbA/BarX family gamma-butyrolactone biosynthesis protein [Streptomyces odontomachi]|uniref:ScbA/BarX family gamma-butyrolactone biosynthesis protein n=1 Tax=Streptomyces odontomachi TaxID=2944940 RepID=UPI00210CC51B|nr:ScbA/BarX family gamma-butyrolactone biosynthesis protein [Streptomyces sp. ODS25]